MQLRFGSPMSFDNRLIEARCIGGAWSLGEAHSQNEHLWNGCRWRHKAQIDVETNIARGFFTRLKAKPRSVRRSQTLLPSAAGLSRNKQIRQQSYNPTRSIAVTCYRHRFAFAVMRIGARWTARLRCRADKRHVQTPTTFE